MDVISLSGEATEYEKKVKLEVRKPKSWCKTVSAFANGDGGILIFGINDDDNIIGLDNPKHDSETISEQIKAKLDPIPTFTLKIDKIEKKTIITVDVKTGDETPYYYIGEGSRTGLYQNRQSKCSC